MPGTAEEGADVATVLASSITVVMMSDDWNGDDDWW
jgi:hypothetical protein